MAADSPRGFREPLPNFHGNLSVQVEAWPGLEKLRLAWVAIGLIMLLSRQAEPRSAMALRAEVGDDARVFSNLSGRFI